MSLDWRILLLADVESHFLPSPCKRIYTTIILLTEQPNFLCFSIQSLVKESKTLFTRAISDDDKRIIMTGKRNIKAVRASYDGLLYTSWKSTQDAYMLVQQVR